MPAFKTYPAIFIVAILSLTQFGSAKVYADQAPHPTLSTSSFSKVYTGLPLPETIELDGRTYTKNELISAFMQAAFNPYIRQGTYIPPFSFDAENANNPMKLKEGYKTQYPWLYEFMYRDEGLPVFLSLAKWSRPMRVSTGFPNDLKPFKPYVGPDGKAVTSGFYSNIDADDIPAEIIEEIKSAAAFVSTVSRMDVSYIAHEQETPEAYAEMRIIFTDFVSNWDSQFKRGKHDVVEVTTGGEYYRRFREWIEGHLYPIYYTPFSKSQVDGYLLLNADNSIGMSFCFIWQGHPMDMVRSLIRECMARSMGATQNIKAYKYNSIMSYWNSWDIRSASQQNKPDLPKRFYEIDAFLLGLLYDPVLKQGMSPVETAKVLFAN